MLVVVVVELNMELGELEDLVVVLLLLQGPAALTLVLLQPQTPVAVAAVREMVVHQ